VSKLCLEVGRQAEAVDQREQIAHLAEAPLTVTVKLALTGPIGIVAIGGRTRHRGGPNREGRAGQRGALDRDGGGIPLFVRGGGWGVGDRGPCGTGGIDRLVGWGGGEGQYVHLVCLVVGNSSRFVSRDTTPVDQGCTHDWPESRLYRLCWHC
jgi:hypothetical protein